MNPVDFRNANWEEIQASLNGRRQRVYEALLTYGPGATRELAIHMREDILAVRPRVTELHQLGLAKCIDDQPTREGHYLAIPIQKAKAEFEQLKAGNPKQQELSL